MNSLNRFADPVYCLMRLIVGLLFACHGAQKMLGMFGGEGMAQGKMMLGGIIELGGLLIAIGLLTRLFAFLGSGMMAVAYFSVHAPKAFYPILNKGEAAVLFCWIFLFMVFYGAGRWSLDALIFKTRASTPPAAL